LQAEESLFVDDNADNVAGARNVGMKAVRFTSVTELERELKDVYGLQF
jgi:FMN phosphatase YigB (HAD superfamily)